MLSYVKWLSLLLKTQFAETLDEEENEEDQGDVDDEINCLQEEQDLPIEELMRKYGYGTVVDTTHDKPSSSTAQRTVSFTPLCTSFKTTSIIHNKKRIVKFLL